MNTIITRKPITINKDVAETCVAIQDCCGDCGVPDNPTVIKIKKAGTCDYLIEYDTVVCCECECDCCEHTKLNPCTNPETIITNFAKPNDTP